MNNFLLIKINWSYIQWIKLGKGMYIAKIYWPSKVVFIYDGFDGTEQGWHSFHFVRSCNSYKSWKGEIERNEQKISQIKNRTKTNEYFCSILFVHSYGLIDKRLTKLTNSFKKNGTNEKITYQSIETNGTNESPPLLSIIIPRPRI